MDLVVRKAERLNHRITKRCSQQGSAVFPNGVDATRLADAPPICASCPAKPRPSNTRDAFGLT